MKVVKLEEEVNLRIVVVSVFCLEFEFYLMDVEGIIKLLEVVVERSFIGFFLDDLIKLLFMVEMVCSY